MKSNVVKMSCKQGFTLIELLVVVLIIGILAAVALPQYQRAVEKARMAEAVANVRVIANAHQLYYMEHGEYLGPGDMNKLDISIPGTEDTTWFTKRIKTKDFIYAPTGDGAASSRLAIAQRVALGGSNYRVYYIFIDRTSPQQINCAVYEDGSATTIQKELCKQLDATGTL